MSKRHWAQLPLIRLQTGAAGFLQSVFSRQGTHLLSKQKGFAASVQSPLSKHTLGQRTPHLGSSVRQSASHSWSQQEGRWTHTQASTSAFSAQPFTPGVAVQHTGPRPPEPEAPASPAAPAVPASPAAPPVPASPAAPPSPLPAVPAVPAPAVPAVPASPAAPAVLPAAPAAPAVVPPAPAVVPPAPAPPDPPLLPPAPPTPISAGGAFFSSSPHPCTINNSPKSPPWRRQDIRSI